MSTLAQEKEHLVGKERFTHNLFVKEPPQAVSTLYYRLYLGMWPLFAFLLIVLAIGNQGLEMASNIIFLLWFLSTIGLTVTMAIMGYLSRKLLIAFVLTPVAAFALVASGASENLLATMGGIVILGLGTASIPVTIWRLSTMKNKEREEPLGFASIAAFLGFYTVFIGMTVAAAIIPIHEKGLSVSLTSYYVIAVCLAIAYLVTFALAALHRKKEFPA